MYVAETKVVRLAEPLEPYIWRIVVHGQSTVLHKQTVGVRPRRSHRNAFLVLHRLVVAEQVHNKLREFQRPLRLFRFSGVGVRSASLRVITGAPYADDVIIKVNVLPLQPEQLAPSEPTVNRQREERAVLDRSLFQEHEKLFDLFERVDLLLLFLALRHADLRAGVLREHIHLHRIRQHVRDEAEVVDDRLARQRLAASEIFPVHREVVDELLDLPRRDLIESHVPDRGEHSLGEVLHSFERGAAKVKLRILLEPLFGEFLKLHVCSHLTV